MAVIGNESSVRTPSGFRVAPQSYRKLDEAADELRAALPKIPGTEIVDAAKVLEKTLFEATYNFHIMEHEHMGSFAAYTVPDMRLVVLRQDVYDGLFSNNVFSRSTVIHELSHIVLQHHVTFHRGAELGKHKFYEDSEWQAKAMTAAVLMPRSICAEVQNAHELSVRCGTSVISATYRLQKLREKGML